MPLASTRRLARTALLAILAAVCAAGLATPARAASGAVEPGSRYLALGDSVTFGYEEPAVVPAPNYPNAASFANYPQELGAVRGLKVTNAACPGETSASLINRQRRATAARTRWGRTGSPCRAGIAPSIPST
jgi:hypothetical protein